MLKIIAVPDKRLRLVSQPIKLGEKKILKFVSELNEALTKKTDPPGIGLSAIQVGKPWRIFSTFLPQTTGTDRPAPQKRAVLTTYLNPQIVKASKKLTLGPNKKKPILEGCLSIPGIYGPVNRHQWVKLKWQMANGKWQMANGKWQMEKFSAFAARVIQHEMDHLNGILFIERSIKQKLPLYEEQDDELTKIST